MRFALGLTIVGAATLICGLMMMLVGETLRLKSAHSQSLVEAGVIAAICGLGFGVALLIVLTLGPPARPRRRTGGQRAGAGGSRGPVLAPLPSSAGFFPPPIAPRPQPAEAWSASGYADDGWHPLSAGAWDDRTRPGRDQRADEARDRHPDARWDHRPDAAWDHRPDAGWDHRPDAAWDHRPDAGWDRRPDAGWDRRPDAGWHPQAGERWDRQAHDGWHPDAHQGPDPRADDHRGSGPAYTRHPAGPDEWDHAEADGWAAHGQNGWVPHGQNGWVPDGRDGWVPHGQDGWVPDGRDGWVPDGRDAWVPDGQDAWAQDARRDWIPDGHGGWADAAHDPWSQSATAAGPQAPAWPAEDPGSTRSAQHSAPQRPHLAGPAGGESPGASAPGGDDLADDDTSPLPVISAAPPGPPPELSQPAPPPEPSRPGPPPEPSRPAPAPEPFSAWEPARPLDRRQDDTYRPGHAEPPSADTQEKIEQIKDLYLTAEAIGEDALVRHFEQLKTRQRSLIREFFEKAGLAPGGTSMQPPADAAGESADSASLPG